MGPPPGGLTTESYGDLGTGFDRLAARYDEIVESNPIHAHLRVRSLAWLDEAFHPGIHVLEIGCGTGTEAIHLARRGVRITATDASAAMVAETEARVSREGLLDRVRVLRCSAGALSGRFERGAFDGAYASFGPLNCEPSLTLAVKAVAAVLKPGAPFLTSVVSRPCAVEIGMSGIRLRPGKAFRRLRTGTDVDLYGEGAVRAQTYSESELRDALAGSFTIERLEGWLVALPPPYMARQWSRAAALHAPLTWIDAQLRRRWPFRGWGDHLHLWARRRSP